MLLDSNHIRRRRPSVADSQFPASLPGKQRCEQHTHQIQLDTAQAEDRSTHFPENLAPLLGPLNTDSFLQGHKGRSCRASQSTAVHAVLKTKRLSRNRIAAHGANACARSRTCLPCSTSCGSRALRSSSGTSSSASSSPSCPSASASSAASLLMGSTKSVCISPFRSTSGGSLRQKWRWPSLPAF